MFNNEVLSRTFLIFSEKECKGSSLLYEYLSKKIARDDTLLEICSNAREGQPIPNLLFGAVHLLDSVVIFGGSAPLSAEVLVNISPKGHDVLRILSPNEVAYLD